LGVSFFGCWLAKRFDSGPRQFVSAFDFVLADVAFDPFTVRVAAARANLAPPARDMLARSVIRPSRAVIRLHIRITDAAGAALEEPDYELPDNIPMSEWPRTGETFALRSATGQYLGTANREQTHF